MQMNRDHGDLNWTAALSRASSISDASDFFPELIFNTSYVILLQQAQLSSVRVEILSNSLRCLFDSVCHAELSKWWEKQKRKRKRNNYLVVARTRFHHRMFWDGEQQLWGRPLHCERCKQGRKAARKHKTRSVNGAAIKCQLWSAVRLMSRVNQRELKGAWGSQGPVSQCSYVINEANRASVSKLSRPCSLLSCLISVSFPARLQESTVIYLLPMNSNWKETKKNMFFLCTAPQHSDSPFN